MKKIFLLLVFCVMPCWAKGGSALVRKPSEFEILTQVAWHEARGEPVYVQQLVLAVVRKRAIMYDMSLYKVVTQKGQFPWTHKLKTWKLTPEQAEWGFQVLSQPRVVTNFVYFNQDPHTFTKKNVKIGGLYFAVK